MSDRLQQIPKQILEWWNKFTSKQKTIIICVGAGIILALAILATVLSRPQKVVLANCESTGQAATIKELLEGDNITPFISADGLQIEVDTKDISQARLVLGKNNIPSTTYELEKVFAGGFSTTELDKQRKYKAYLEDKMKEDFKSYEFVKSVVGVSIEIPVNDGTLLSEEKEGFVSIILETEGELPMEAANGMAMFAKNVIGNITPNNIVIMDTKGVLLYSGEDNYSVSGSANNQLGVKQQYENIVKNDVKKVLTGTGQFGKIEVGANLVVDFGSLEKTEKMYDLPEGQEQGLVVHEDIYNAESTGGTSGLPGTDSNTESTYVFQDNNYSTSTTSEESKDRVVNETVTSQNIPPGAIKYNESSIAVTATVYKMTKEEDAKKQGLLDGISWDEYKVANSEKKKLTVEDDLIQIVAKTTGIQAEEISIMAFEEPIFVDKEGLAVQPTDVVQVVLILLILGLLAFVVLRSMKTDKGEEAVEEISVANLLQSTPEVELNNIELETKSETRRVIEKFVEDNPEAVASLLRNWLNEDWG